MPQPPRLAGWTLVEAAYSERLTAPLRWWVQATMSLAVVWLAMIVSTPTWLAWTGTGAFAAVTYGLLGYVGAAVVRVEPDLLRAGRARIPTVLLGPPEALDADATRRVLGVDADARAFLLTRPYLKRAVRVPVLDPADPAPYWLISSRHPDRLAAALSAT